MSPWSSLLCWLLGIEKEQLRERGGISVTDVSSFTSVNKEASWSNLACLCPISHCRCVSSTASVTEDSLHLGREWPFPRGQPFSCWQCPVFAALSSTETNRLGLRVSSCLPCAPSMSVPAPCMELCLMQGALELEFTFTPLCRNYQVRATGTLTRVDKSILQQLLPEINVLRVCDVSYRILQRLNVFLQRTLWTITEHIWFNSV